MAQTSALRGGIKPGGVDLSLYIMLYDSTTGSPKTGVAYTSVTTYYFRQGAASAVQITMASLAAVNSAHADGGWKEIDATNIPGLYRLDVTDAFWATGADWVHLNVRVSGADDVNVSFNLDVFVVDSSGRIQVQTGTGTGQISATAGIAAVNVTQCGGSTVAAGAIPNAAAAANGGLPTVDASNGVKISVGTGTGQVNLSTGNVPIGSFATDSITAAALATDAAQEIADTVIGRTLGTESYATDGSVPTLAQILFQIWAFIKGHSVSGTTLTIYKLDDSTTAMTFTLSPNATNPTQITRTS